MIKTSGSQTFMKRIRKDVANLEGRVTKIHRALVKSIFTDLVTFTPQWSGNAASNWYITFKGMPAKYNEIEGYVPPYMWDSATQMTEPYQLGMDPVVRDTVARESLLLNDIKWNTKVTIVNTTPYAEDLENNIGPMGENDYEPREIRDVNFHPNYGKVAMIAYVETKYRNLRYLKMLAK